MCFIASGLVEMTEQKKSTNFPCWGEKALLKHRALSFH